MCSPIPRNMLVYAAADQQPKLGRGREELLEVSRHVVSIDCSGSKLAQILI